MYALGKKNLPKPDVNYGCQYPCEEKCQHERLFYCYWKDLKTVLSIDSEGEMLITILRTPFYDDFTIDVEKVCEELQRQLQEKVMR